MAREVLTAMQIARMVQMARQSFPPREIAATLGLEVNVIRVRLCRMRKNGPIKLPDANKRLTDSQVKDFFKKHEGKTIAQIHRDTGHARDYITRLLDRWAGL